MARDYKLFYAILATLKGYEKEDAVYDYTDGRTARLSQLSDEEYIGLCKHLNNLSIKNSDYKNAGSTILNILTGMGFRTINKLGWQEIDKFFLNPRIAGKRYCQTTIEERRELIPKLRKIRDSGYKNKHVWE